jgi:hypothetical protein
MKPMRTIGTAIVLGLGAGLLGATGAAAAPLDTCAAPTAVSWDQPVNQSVSFGEFWSYSATGTGLSMIETWTADGSAGDTPSGYAPQIDSFPPGDDACARIVTIAGDLDDWLRPGTYTLKVWIDRGDATRFEPSQPTTLKVTAAELGVVARITADPTNSRNAIVTTQFSGDFAQSFFDFWGTTSTPGAPHTPEGTWKVRIRDGGGTIVQEFTAERSATSDDMGESWMWSDVPAGDYSMAATFTPSGDSTTDFAFTPASPFAFTAEGPAPGDGPTASPAPSAPPARPSSEFTVPAWVPIAAGVISLGLIAFAIVQIVRLTRRRTPGMASEGSGS